MDLPETAEASRIVIHDDLTPPDQRLGPPWEVLVVDCADDANDLSGMVLAGMVYRQRPIHLHFVVNRRGAMEFLEREGHQQFCLALVDEDMEDHGAGLLLVQEIRERLANAWMRLVLRGNGRSPTIDAGLLDRYEVSEYRRKSDLRGDHLVAVVLANLRAHQQLIDLDRERRRLDRLHRSCGLLLSSLCRGQDQVSSPKEICEATCAGCRWPLSALEQMTALAELGRPDHRGAWTTTTLKEFQQAIAQGVPGATASRRKGIPGRFAINLEATIRLLSLLAHALREQGLGLPELDAQAEGLPIAWVVVELRAGSTDRTAPLPLLREQEGASISLSLARCFAEHLDASLSVDEGCVRLRIPVDPA